MTTSTREDVPKTSLLKTPAVEVIDLISDMESVGVLGDKAVKREKRKREDEFDEFVDVTDVIEVQDEEDEDTSDAEPWETESLYEDALEGLGDEQLNGEHGSDEICTLQEALAFRNRLREVGDDKFIEETIEAGTITAKKLCTAFGIRPPPFLEDAPDNAYYPLLGLGISRELSKRLKLSQYNTVDDVVALLKKSKNIIVLTGAGISTSLGIPDFRSKDTGLYSRLAYLGLSDPQEVFDIGIFREDPSIFYSVARDILPSTNKFSPTHAFIRLLQEKNKLLTNFTQNIDNLEGHAGILSEKLIQCHGSFATASCIECKYKVNGEEIYPDLRAGRVARCPRCTQQLRSSRAPHLKRKRSSNSSGSNKKRREDYEDSPEEEESNIPEAGVMKPDITFFGEVLPPSFHTRLLAHDRPLVDLVLVIGTSLKVAPVSEIVSFLPPTIPQVYINKTECKHVNFDVELLGRCDVVVQELVRRLGRREKGDDGSGGKAEAEEGDGDGEGWVLEHEMCKEREVVVRGVEGCVGRWVIEAKDALMT
ncbi:MAG: NAD-dependent histone deacetylase sir2 [Icmadophila ericetorum]|nr:NAD-dependent histone deacetylase sir2 [Icmadophila ericetorum]